MIGINTYLNAYVDRRMKYIVDEWDLVDGHGSRGVHATPVCTRKGDPRPEGL